MHHPIAFYRRLLLTGLVAGVMTTALHAEALYPARPITMIVGWPAGGPSDNVARLVAKRMAEILGQAIVIDNRAGAGSNIGSEMAARAKPDGYTILFATGSSHGLNSALYANLPYKPIEDFAPIGFISTSPGTLLVPANSPFKSVHELVQAAKASPGRLNYGSAGIGSSQHLAAAAFRSAAGVDVTHIPFKGTAPAIADLMAGRVDFIITTGAVPFVRSGKVRALAVAAQQRLTSLPDVPTFEEAGMKGFVTDSWYGLVAPAGTPVPVLQVLNAALIKTLATPEIRKAFVDQGAVPGSAMSPDAFWSFVKGQMATAAQLVKTSGAKLE